MALESLKDIFEKAGGSGGGVTPSNPSLKESEYPFIFNLLKSPIPALPVFIRVCPCCICILSLFGV